MVLGKGLEPSRLTARASKTLVSTIPPPEQDAVTGKVGQPEADEASVVLSPIPAPTRPAPLHYRLVRPLVLSTVLPTHANASPHPPAFIPRRLPPQFRD